MHTSDVMLDIRNLVVEYATVDGVVHAVNDISLSVKRQRCMGLVGETGAGKTSTALAVMNLIPTPPGVIRRGSILVNGYNVLRMKDTEMDAVRGKEVAMIFQDPMTALNPVLTIGSQIAESILLHEKVSGAEAEKRAMNMLEMVGIKGTRANDYPHQLSGGMKQRVVIAIALCCNPHLLIADEPTTALDVTIQAQVLELIDELRENYKTSMLLITHDLGIVGDMCDEVSVMYAGRIVESGTVKDVFTDTRHPYTEGLFNSLPNINNRAAQLTPIPGLMPDPTDLPPGCAFSPRCRYARSKCRERVPEAKWIGDTHMVACIAYEDPGFRIERSKR
ncbi:MAG: Oligopeptide transport ATP-binding protein OppD [Firmicutes bacterium ADurb.Bin248]|nr:MAG: Oligopeptide transport ATP-binding protein OppD [Firmicutes bacterium ADurb.Bin248]